MTDDPPEWKVFYDDGSTVTDQDQFIAEIPRRGVQAIVQRDEDVGRVVLSREDYYWWDGERSTWFCGDRFGLFDYLAQPGWKLVLFGRTLMDEEFEAILERAVTDDDFPAKSATNPRRESAVDGASGEES